MKKAAKTNTVKAKLFGITLAVVVGSSASATTPVEKETKTVDAEQSQVTWKAYKVTGSHTGTVDLKKGELKFEDGKLIGGQFEVDMSSLVATDLEGESKGNLEGHLKSDDFFSVENHPTSTLVFNKVKATGKNSYEVTGDLTIKGISKPVTFDLSVYGSKATATVKVDRTAYDIRFNSGNFFQNLGDKTIYDEFDLIVDLEF